MNDDTQTMAMIDRIPYGEHHTDPGYEECPGCTATEGELHDLGCDHERCPICDGQLVFCEHYDDYETGRH